MITMTNLGSYGRLGNQLFQYAMLKSVSHKLNIELKIPNPKDTHCQGQNCLLNNFTLSCSFLENQDFNKIKQDGFEVDYEPLGAEYGEQEIEILNKDIKPLDKYVVSLLLNEQGTDLTNIKELAKSRNIKTFPSKRASSPYEK